MNGELSSRVVWGTGNSKNHCSSAGCQHRIQIFLRETGLCLFPFRTHSLLPSKESAFTAFLLESVGDHHTVFQPSRN